MSAHSAPIKRVAGRSLAWDRIDRKSESRAATRNGGRERAEMGRRAQTSHLIRWPFGSGIRGSRRLILSGRQRLEREGGRLIGSPLAALLALLLLGPGHPNCEPTTGFDPQLESRAPIALPFFSIQFIPLSGQPMHFWHRQSHSMGARVNFANLNGRPGAEVARQTQAIHLSHAIKSE